MKPPRLAPHIPFPDYSYVPRRFPHPTRDAEGHSHGRDAATTKELTQDNWRTSEQFLFGIDLFNHGYYWEAHEAWESVWHACGRKGDVAEFLKALIKLAAAGVKAREGNENGVERAARRAAELFRELDSGQEFLGFKTSTLVHESDQLAVDSASVLNTSDSPVIVALPFQLAPNLQSEN